MRWEGFGQSDNVRNRRGEGGSAFGGGGGIGAGAVLMLVRFVFSRFGIVGVIVLIGGYFLLTSLGGGLVSQGGTQRASGGEAPSSAYDREIGAVLLSTERVWTEQFQANGLGDYPEPNLNLFAGGIQTQGCGFANAAVGPFYGPGERITVRHMATDRGIFARGALAAAKWGQGRPPGLYDMNDVLGL